MNPMYDLEQPLLNAASMVDDLRILVENNATPNDYLALAAVYDIKFTRLWDIFEETLSKVNKETKQ